MSTFSSPQTGPWFLADHPALDFINTVMMQDGQPQDYLRSDDDVCRWLEHARLAVRTTDHPFKPGALLKEAVALRETIRHMVTQKKAGEDVEPEAINRYLAAAQSTQQLVAKENGTLHLTRQFTGKTPVEMLAPLAEQAALLMADPQFTLVKACEHPECSLWFYDRTKAHRRRWCSMAVCGNRAKVARFREQKK